MSTKKKPSKKSGKPDQQAKQPPAPHGHDRTTGPLIQKLMKAHDAFNGAFCKSLWFAKEGGEIILTLQARTGLNGIKLFASIRKHAKRSISDRSFFLYRRIASHWNELRIEAGDKLNEMTLTQAIKLLHQSKDEKPPQQRKENPPPPEAKPEEAKEEEKVKNTTTEAKPEEAKEEEKVKNTTTEAKPEEAKEEEKEKPIIVWPPFDEPEKDRIAALYARNGPAPTPIIIMTNFIIPGLKKVAECGVSENEVPFLANAIKEALALIEALKQKYAIV